MIAARPDPAQEWLALLPATPDAYPQNLELAGGRVLVVRLDEGVYRTASFLDDRVLTPAVRGAWLPLAAVIDASRRVSGPRPLHFIFHTGHVGSTLLSRLLDETGAVLGLREPLPLRTLADARDVLAAPESLLSGPQYEALTGMLLRLWSRGYSGTQAVVVKATSSAGRIAPELLAAAPAARAVYLNLRAEPYLATLLGGANSAADLRGHGPGRIRRLLAHAPLPVAPLHALGPGELAALGWLTETLACVAAAQAAGDRLLSLDFDAFLADVAGAMARVLAHFGLRCDAGFLAALPGHPALGRYSKAPERPYAPRERAESLAQSRRENAAQIRAGLAWLERLARADERVAALVQEGAP